MKRDAYDHVRFSPLQTELSRGLLKDFGIPFDVTTAVLAEQNINNDISGGVGVVGGGGGGDTVGIGQHQNLSGYTNSTCILRLLRHMGSLYGSLGSVLLWIPRPIRDVGYRLFGRNRGTIWKLVKRITGLGDTEMESYRNKVIGIAEDETNPPGWGFRSSCKKE